MLAIATVVIKAYPGSDRSSDYAQESDGPILWNVLSEHFQSKVTAVYQFGSQNLDEPAEVFTKTISRPAFMPPAPETEDAHEFIYTAFLSSTLSRYGHVLRMLMPFSFFSVSCRRFVFRFLFNLSLEKQFNAAREEYQSLGQPSEGAAAAAGTRATAP